jgi:hypothetical protein
VGTREAIRTTRGSGGLVMFDIAIKDINTYFDKTESDFGDISSVLKHISSTLHYVN